MDLYTKLYLQQIENYSKQPDENMRKIDISEYGKRNGFLRTFTAGEGQVTGLHFPSNPSMQHAFIKMLLIINANKKVKIRI